MTISTVEAKFVSFKYIVQEVVWLKIFFEHLSITKNPHSSKILYCDSQEAITYVKGP